MALLGSRNCQRSDEIVTPPASLAPHRTKDVTERHIAEQPLKVGRREMAGDLAKLACDSHQLAGSVRLAERLLTSPRHPLWRENMLLSRLKHGRRRSRRATRPQFVHVRAK
jgi:hypothetical protein